MAEVSSRTAMLEPEKDWLPSLGETDRSIDLGAVLGTLYRRRGRISAVTLAGLALATAIAFLLPPEYTSVVSFIPPTSTNSSSAAALAGQLSQLSGGASLLGGPKSTGDLYVGILKSRSIKSELVDRFDLRRIYKVKKESQAEKALVSRSTFEVGVKDPIVTIAVTDRSPERARDIANAYVDALRETNSRLALTESSQRRLFFGQQLAKEKDALEDAEVELKKSEEHSGLIAPVGQTATEIQILAQTRGQISLRQVELSALRQGATDQNPDVIRVRSEIAELEAQLARLQTGTGKSGSGAIPTSKVPELQLDYVRKTREVRYHEVLFEMLSRQYETARMDEAHDAPLLQVLDTASYPDSKSAPKRMLIMLGGVLFGLFAGILWVLFGERIAQLRGSLLS